MGFLDDLFSLGNNLSQSIMEQGLRKQIELSKRAGLYEKAHQYQEQLKELEKQKKFQQAMEKEYLYEQAQQAGENEHQESENNDKKKMGIMERAAEDAIISAKVINGKKISQWESEWISLGKVENLTEDDFSKYKNVLGLSRIIVESKFYALSATIDNREFYDNHLSILAELAKDNYYDIFPFREDVLIVGNLKTNNIENHLKDLLNLFYYKYSNFMI